MVGALFRVRWLPAPADRSGARPTVKGGESCGYRQDFRVAAPPLKPYG